MQIFLSVVIPCYNEEQNIRLGALDKVARYLEKQPYKWEVLVVDDGSTDASVALIKKFASDNFGFRLVAREHAGKAATVVAGMLLGKGDHILFSDLDQATPIDQLEKLLPWVEKGYDIVIGSRQGRRAGAPFLRRIMGPGFMIARNIILGLGGISDTQCGFKLFKKEVAQSIFPRLVLYKGKHSVSGPRVTAGFDVELLFIAHTLGFRTKEVPVEWHYVDTRRVSPLTDSVDAFIDIIKIRRFSLQGRYQKSHLT